jgi:hypothetical protein
VTRSCWRHVPPLVFVAALLAVGWHGWSRLDHRPLRMMQTPVGTAREVVRLQGGDVPFIPPTFAPGEERLLISSPGTFRALFSPLATLRPLETLWVIPITRVDNEFPLHQLGIQRHHDLHPAYDQEEQVLDASGRWASAIIQSGVAFGHLPGEGAPFLGLLLSELTERRRVLWQVPLQCHWQQHKCWFTVSPAGTLVTFPHAGGLWLLRLRKPLPELVKEAGQRSRSGTSLSVEPSRVTHPHP